MTTEATEALQHHEMRVVGPPGTGKTTFVTRQVRRAVALFSADKVVVASMTKAAAAELGGRDLPIPASNIGTLHAHAFRSLDHPIICESPDKLAEWNAWAAEHGFPFWRLSGAASTKRAGADPEDVIVDEAPQQETEGDRRLAMLQIYRARQTNPLVWPGELQRFADSWNAWKRANSYVDFTDLIEIAYETIEECPGKPSVIMVDECQDLSRLEIALARKWGQKAQHFVMVGDSWQNLYSWRGSDAEAFFEHPLPKEQVRVLAQSYRVPRQVHKAAVNWMRQATNLDPVEYLPRNEEGECLRMQVTLRDPATLLRRLDPYLKAGKSIMFLASCAYMLAPLLRELRERGLPFHNPYRRRRGDWNPLFAAQGVSSAERLAGFLRNDEARMWSGRELKGWLSLIKTTGVLRRGGKGVLDTLLAKREDELTLQETLWVCEEAVLEPSVFSVEAACSWLEERLLEGRRPGTLFPLQVARRQGPAALRQTPKLLVGTVHSVKGGEAEVVALFPDLSPQGWNGGWQTAAGRNAVLRLFYVGMTRARETLILCDGSGSTSVPWTWALTK